MGEVLVAEDQMTDSSLVPRTYKHTNVLVVSDIFGHFAVYSARTFGAKYEQRVSTV